MAQQSKVIFSWVFLKLFSTFAFRMSMVTSYSLPGFVESKFGISSSRRSGLAFTRALARVALMWTIVLSLPVF